ncbi:hypothetical protein NITGR_190028 [Nitrospina gracilis 3/211]|uniref:Uncharacterized protein n=1 Tax=Nitrospina gracilis (strain 3/211) TaxID=1266370 RepID=M1YXA1_NITG3|nr:hypothetical protein NITGR_190028 [Nitrospina gracilis 3/211]
MFHVEHWGELRGNKMIYIGFSA